MRLLNGINCFWGPRCKVVLLLDLIVFKEFDGKKTKEGMIQPKSEEDLKNAFKLIKKYISRHKTGQWAKQDRDKLEEIISEFGL